MPDAPSDAGVPANGTDHSVMGWETVWVMTPLNLGMTIMLSLTAVLTIWWAAALWRARRLPHIAARSPTCILVGAIAGAVWLVGLIPANEHVAVRALVDSCSEDVLRARCEWLHLGLPWHIGYTLWFAFILYRLGIIDSNIMQRGGASALTVISAYTVLTSWCFFLYILLAPEHIMDVRIDTCRDPIDIEHGDPVCWLGGTTRWIYGGMFGMHVCILLWALRVSRTPFREVNNTRAMMWLAWGCLIVMLGSQVYVFQARHHATQPGVRFDGPHAVMSIAATGIVLLMFFVQGGDKLLELTIHRMRTVDGAGNVLGALFCWPACLLDLRNGYSSIDRSGFASLAEATALGAESASLQSVISTGTIKWEQYMASPFGRAHYYEWLHHSFPVFVAGENMVQDALRARHPRRVRIARLLWAWYCQPTIRKHVVRTPLRDVADEHSIWALWSHGHTELMTQAKALLRAYSRDEADMVVRAWFRRMMARGWAVGYFMLEASVTTPPFALGGSDSEGSADDAPVSPAAAGTHEAPDALVATEGTADAADALDERRFHVPDGLTDDEAHPILAKLLRQHTRALKAAIVEGVAPARLQQVLQEFSTWVATMHRIYLFPRYIAENDAAAETMVLDALDRGVAAADDGMHGLASETVSIEFSGRGRRGGDSEEAKADEGGTAV